MPKESTIVFAELVKARRTRVRYGRATLTLTRSGGLTEGDLARAITNYEAGELEAEDLIWAFVRDRVVGHSPSFRWEDADLGRVSTLVTAASYEPEFPDLPPERLAPALLVAAAEERERWGRLNQRLAKSIRGSLPGYSKLLAKDAARVAPGPQMPAHARLLKTARAVTATGASGDLPNMAKFGVGTRGPRLDFGARLSANGIAGEAMASAGRRVMAGTLPTNPGLGLKRQIGTGLVARLKLVDSAAMEAARSAFLGAGVASRSLPAERFGFANAGAALVREAFGLRSPSIAGSMPFVGIGGSHKLAEQIALEMRANSVANPVELGSAIFPGVKTLGPPKGLGDELAASITARFATGRGFIPALPDGFFAKQNLGSVGLFDEGQRWPGIDQKLLEKMRKEAMRWRERFRRALAPNWQDLEPKEVDRVAELMGEEGLCLAWAPRVEIVREILDAPDAEARGQLLLRHREVIVADVEAVLAGIAREDLGVTTDAVAEAIATYRSGFAKAAQSYLVVALTDLVHGFWGKDHAGPVKERFIELDPQEVAIGEFTYASVGRAWIVAHGRIEDAGEWFNRNVAAHRLGPHYNEVNLLAALLLVAGLLPELERRRNREEFSRAEETVAVAATIV